MEKDTKPFIVPIFLPQAGCPHQCVFCNQFSITGADVSLPGKEEIRRRINQYLTYKNKARRGLTQIAFYGGNFLGMEKQYIDLCLTTAQQYVTEGEVDSIRFSTRPDTINEGTIDTITRFSVATVEIGAQSMDDHVLRRSNRGHTALQIQQAATILKEHHFQTGIQMMVGLPGDSKPTIIETTSKIISLSPDFVRIYPTIVLSNSPLARLYKNGTYQPLPLASAVSIVKTIFLRFIKNRIPVIRMGLQPSVDFEMNGKILAGPFHPSFGHLVYSEIFLDKLLSIIKTENWPENNLSIFVHPKNISMVRGIKNRNKTFLNQLYPKSSITISGQAALEPNDLIVNKIKVSILD